MALLTRVFVLGAATEPEDYLAESLGIIFPDDITNQHGDAEHALEYRSPNLPKPLHIELGDPMKNDERLLFSHYLWNASLMLAEMVEAGCLGLQMSPRLGSVLGTTPPFERTFDVKGLRTMELGAGTALPSMMASVLGAEEVVVTDYPSEPLMKTLRRNIAYNVKPEFSPGKTVSPVAVDGHEWGDLDTPFAKRHRAVFDRLFVCDCLWMPWQHENLQKSIAWFMKDDAGSRAWVVAGFHTGRSNMSGFFEKDGLAAVGLEVECIWERDCNGIERTWAEDRGAEGQVKKRWLVIAVLRRVRRGEER